MTREELVHMREYKVAQASTEYWNKNKNNDEVSILTDFEGGAEWADEHPKNPWISVKDELPYIHTDGHYHTSDYVLVKVETNETCLAFINEELTWMGKNVELPYPVTHWMPIPKLPEGDAK